VYAHRVKCPVDIDLRRRTELSYNSVLCEFRQFANEARAVTATALKRLVYYLPVPRKYSAILDNDRLQSRRPSVGFAFVVACFPISSTARAILGIRARDRTTARSVYAIGEGESPIGRKLNQAISRRGQRGAPSGARNEIV